MKRKHIRQAKCYIPEDMKLLVEQLKERPMTVIEMADCLKLDRTRKTWMTQLRDAIATIGLDYAISDVKFGVYKIYTKKDYDDFEKERKAKMELMAE